MLSGTNSYSVPATCLVLVTPWGEEGEWALGLSAELEDLPQH